MTARKEIARIAAVATSLDRPTLDMIEVLLVRIERQADAIAKQAEEIAMLKDRTAGLVRCR